MIYYRNAADMMNSVFSNLYKISGKIDLVVGVPRSGLLAASIIATYLHLPLVDVDDFLAGKIFKAGQRLTINQEKLFGKERLKVLVVDDSLSTGTQMRSVKSSVESSHVKHDIYYGAIYVVPGMENLLDFWCEIVPQPRYFQWNIYNSDIIPHSCVDIDGVLCRDPSSQENDDGENYVRFLKSVESKIIPSIKIGWLVTCRLEKYRSLTEEWLCNNKIAYDKLIMLDLPSKEARLKANIHSYFKARVYKETSAKLFIESSASQAEEVAKFTNKYTYCSETGEMLHYPTLISTSRKSLLDKIRYFRNKLLQTL